jgi:hydroxymethylbilane synthase
MRVGTRGSALALVQARWVAERLGPGVEVVEVTTLGDRGAAVGDKSRWVSELERALLEGRIDVAVHSAKDVPTELPEGLGLVAIPERAEARDVICGVPALAELAPGARVGTSSLRRTAQVRAVRDDLDVREVRGNVDTRLRKVRDGELDAVVLAYAGLRRLGRGDEASEVLDPIQVLPAPAQGALAVECRSGDDAARAVLTSLDHADTRAAVAAERALLEALEAGCSAPVGALAEVAEGDDGPEIFLRASVTALDGSDAVRLSATGPTDDADGVGRRLAAELLADGAATMMGSTT